jgi:hypothetical protein
MAINIKDPLSNIFQPKVTLNADKNRTKQAKNDFS